MVEKKNDQSIFGIPTHIEIVAGNQKPVVFSFCGIRKYINTTIGKKIKKSDELNDIKISLSNH